MKMKDGKKVPIFMNKGGMAVSPRKKMAMGMMKKGGMAKKYRKGGMACS